MSKELVATVKEIISNAPTRKEGIRNAHVFVDTLLRSLEEHRQSILAEYNTLTASLQALQATAMRTQSEADVCKWSEVQANCERLSKLLTDGTCEYSVIEIELKKLQQSETARTTPLTIVRIDAGSVGAVMAVLRNDIATLIATMANHWTTYDDSMENRVEKIVNIQFDGRAIDLGVADVRGDGACGWRAFIAGAIRLLTGKRLSFDPAGMTNYVTQVKQLMFRLIEILTQTPGNEDFITSLYNNPDNGECKTFQIYTAMVANPSYYATNFELRLLCVLFGMFDPQLSQVNIIRENPSSVEVYQSLSASGQIAPVSNSQINILIQQVRRHYMSIYHLTEGILPRIYSIEAPLRF